MGGSAGVCEPVAGNQRVQNSRPSAVSIQSDSVLMDKDMQDLVELFSPEHKALGTAKVNACSASGPHHEWCG